MADYSKNIPGHTEETMDDFIAQWEKIVQEIEGGYGFTGYDYVNDLNLRMKILIVGKMLSPEGEMFVEKAMEPLDARFMATTTPYIMCPVRLLDLQFQRVPVESDKEFLSELPPW